jgi:hypothetical protein
MKFLINKFRDNKKIIILFKILNKNRKLNVVSS